MATSIARELADLAQITPNKGEDAQAFLSRLAVGVNEADEAEWKKMSGKAQKWANNAVDAIEAKTDIVAPDGLDALMKAAAKAEPEETGKKKTGKKDAPAAAAKGKTAKTKTKDEPAAKGKGKKAAAKDEPKTAKGKGKKAAGPGGRARLSDDLTVNWKKKELPTGHRNKYQKDVPQGTKLGDLRKKNKTLFRAVKFWRRKGFVELVAPK